MLKSTLEKFTYKKLALGGMKMAVKMKPLGDRVVIEPSEDDAEKSAGGIYIPDTAKVKPQKGKPSSGQQNGLTRIREIY